MKHRVAAFIVLVFFRVFIIPAWFSLHIDEVKDASEAYEHVRLKKRRSTFLEENLFVQDLTHQQAALFSPGQRVVFFRSEPAPMLAPSPGADGILSLVSSHIVLPIYLRNRMLRI